MERTKGIMVEQEQRIRWRKVGGGTLRLKNPPRIIKPNEIFKAFPSEIPKQFRDVIIALEPIPVIEAPIKGTPVIQEEPAPAPADAVMPVYKLQLRGNSKSWYDVIGPNGKPINEKALTKVVATQLIKDLEK